MNSAAKNLAAIHRAIVQHNGNCGAPITAILLNPFEVSRLGFEDFEGIPIKAEEKLGTGCFRLVCEGQHGSDAAETSTAKQTPAKVGEIVPA